MSRPIDINSVIDDGINYGDFVKEVHKYMQDHPGVSFDDAAKALGYTSTGSHISSAKSFKEKYLDPFARFASDSFDDFGATEEQFNNPNINPDIDTPVEINQSLLDYYDSVLERQDARVQAQNAFNAEEAQKNRDFQSEMSNTAYQRAVTDMKAAGINPLMAYSQGGASTPSGASATSTYTAVGAPSPVTSLDVGNLSVSQISNVLKDANLTQAQKEYFINKLFDMVSSAKKDAANLASILMFS